MTTGPETQFEVLSLGGLAWPLSLRLPARRFRLLVAADTTRMSVHEISDFARAALGKGMVYLCAWGRGCERFHDIADTVIAEDDRGDRRFAGPGRDDRITTTWHDRDTLEGALDFFARCAIPTEGLLEDSAYRLVICVGNPDWAGVAARFLRAAPICRSTLDWYQAVVDAPEAGHALPEKIVRSANFLSDLMHPQQQRTVAALIYDSSRRVAVAGVRGAGQELRQLLFQSGDLVVDVVADTRSEGELVHLVGQVMRKKDPYLNVPISLQKGAEQCVTFTNRFGEFQFDTGKSDRLTLVVVLPGSRVIEIPLGMLEASR